VSLILFQPVGWGILTSSIPAFSPTDPAPRRANSVVFTETVLPRSASRSRGQFLPSSASAGQLTEARE